MENHSQLLLKTLKKMSGFNKVRFIILYGSHATGKKNKLSDVDFAIFYDGNKEERFKFRIKSMAKLPDKFDVQIFQDLPLFVRKDVLKGKIVYAKNTSYAYDVAYQTIKEFDEFKKAYYDYIGLEAII